MNPSFLHRWRRATLCLLAVASYAPWANAESWLYLSSMQDKEIIVYQRNGATGELTRKHTTSCPAEPGVLCASPDRKTLFVAMRSSGQLASYRINNDGSLKPISIVDGGADPCYFFTDRAGRYLLTAYYVANQVTVHKIRNDNENPGAIDPTPIQVVPTAKNAHAIHLDANDQFAYVPHTGANRIFQFRFDKRTGQLSPLALAAVELSKGDEPRHVAIHPNGKWVYSNNEAGDSLNAFERDSVSGVLSRTQKLTTLPDGFDPSRNTTARCEMTSDGRFIYVANRGSNTIAGFSVDPNNGKLEPLGLFETEATPRSLTIDSQRRFLYAAGQDSHKVAVYAMTKDGKLNRTRTYDVAKKPWCVLAVDTGPVAGVGRKVIRDIKYASIEDHDLLLDLHLPTSTGRPAPMVVWVHGGAWRAGSKKNMPLDWLVDEGYAVASIDYRLSPVAPFPAQMHDCKAAIRFLRAKASDFGVDATRIGVAGSSAGGHLVALMGTTNGHAVLEGTVGDHTDQSSDVHAIVDYYGPTNFMTILNQSTPHGLSVRVPALQLLLGAKPESVPELAKTASPVFHVDGNDPPLLLIHGDQDPQVPINQSLELQGAYQRAELDVQFEVVSGGLHGGEGFFDQRRQKLVSDFFAKHLHNVEERHSPHAD